MYIDIQFEQGNASPRIVRVKTDATLSQVTTAGFLNGAAAQGIVIQPSDKIEVYYGIGGTPNNAMFDVSISSGIITLSVAESGVVLPVVSGNIAVFSGTAGAIADPSGAASHYGNIYAGVSGTAGVLRSYPSTAASGYLALAAANSAGDYAAIITNASLGQASTWTLADPAAAASKILQAAGALVNGNFPVASGTAGLMVDSGLAAANIQNKTNIVAATTADIGGGGAGPISVVVAGATAASVVVASVESSSNPVSVVACTATATGFDITFSADPGAACLVNYVLFIAAQ